MSGELYDWAGIPHLQRQSDPEPPTDTAPGRIFTDRGFRPAVAASPVPYRRYCQGCAAFRYPVKAPRPVPIVFMANIVIDTTTPMLTMCHRCPSCRSIWAGPIPVAQWRRIGRFLQYELHLSMGGGYATATVDEILADQADFELVDYTWHKMERALLDQITYRALCSVAGCEERARGFFGVLRPMEFAGVTWMPGTDLDVCPRHESDLRRDPRYPWPLFPPQRR